MENISLAYAEIKSKLEKALSIASKYGKIIGFVSRFTPSRISDEGPILQFDVDPYEYFINHECVASAGNFLAVVDIKTCEIVSLRIKGIERKDVMAEARVPEAMGLKPKIDASGLITKARIYAEPLLAWNPETNEVKAVTYVIEPQSPVIKPKSEVLEKIIGLPNEGVVLGALTVNEVNFEYVKVKLPLRAFYQHILVLGTTGSGKTTFLKNLIISLLNAKDYKIDESLKPTVIVIDSTKDYLHTILEPKWEVIDPYLRKVEENLALYLMNGSWNVPQEITIILPITKYLISELCDNENIKDSEISVFGGL